MSVIAGVNINNHTTLLAADNLAQCGDQRSFSFTKVCNLGCIDPGQTTDRLALAGCGEIRAIQAVMVGWEHVLKGWREQRAEGAAQAIMRVLAAEGYVSKSVEGAKTYPCTFLLATARGVWSVFGEATSVRWPENQFTAHGSGGPYALGAWDGAGPHRRKDLTTGRARKALGVAMASASKHATSVGSTFTLLTLTMGGAVDKETLRVPRHPGSRWEEIG